MSALPLPDLEPHSPEELAQYIISAQSWKEIEVLTTAYSDLKVAAWGLLSEADQIRIKQLKQWKDNPVALKFPLGCGVERVSSNQKQVGTVINYWSAYGIDYITFQVGSDIDWCRASYLKRTK
ncbi:MAG: hypothetical protein WBA13_02205 [Microcoleaceae cyanobacterium]